MPFAGILGQTSGQVIYGSVIKNWFIFWGNAPGLAIGLWLTLSTIVHARPRVSAMFSPIMSQNAKSISDCLIGSALHGLSHILTLPHFDTALGLQ